MYGVLQEYKRKWLKKETIYAAIKNYKGDGSLIEKYILDKARKHRLLGEQLDRQINHYIFMDWVENPSPSLVNPVINNKDLLPFILKYCPPMVKKVCKFWLKYYPSNTQWVPSEPLRTLSQKCDREFSKYLTGPPGARGPSGPPGPMGARGSPGDRGPPGISLEPTKVYYSHDNKSSSDYYTKPDEDDASYGRPYRKNGKCNAL